MKEKLLQAAAALAVGFTVASADAGISIDFYRSTSHNLTGATPVGVAPVAAEDWNIVETNVASFSVNDENGNPAASISVSSSPFNGDLFAGDTNDNFEMANTGGRLRDNKNTYNDFITVTGLGPDYTTLGYDVILYVADRDDDGSNDQVQIRLNDVGSTTGDAFFIDSVSYNGSFVQGTSTDGNTGVIEGNYLRWTGLTGSEFGLSFVGGVDSDLVISGLQIVPVIPEPASLTLLGLGALVALKRR